MTPGKLPRKSSEMSTAELYEHFKNGMISLVEMNFSEPGANPPPSVFLGVRKSALEKKLNKVKEEGKVDKYKIERMSEDLVEDNDNKIHTLHIDLGMFFMDHGNDFMNAVSKDAAQRMVKDAISSMQKEDINSVMFMCFISEAFMTEIPTDKISPQHLKMIEQHEIQPEELIAKYYPQFMDNLKKDKVVLMFETSTFSEVVSFDVLQNEERTFKELINMHSIGRTEGAASGLFGGMLHKRSRIDLN